MRYYRIRASDLAVVEISGNSCKNSSVKFEDALGAVKLFKKHGTLKLIRDGKFLKGGFRGGKVTGERIDVLPDGTKLGKAFPLFAPRLRVHDEKSCSHWDVIFENLNGSFTYIYSISKMKTSRAKKYRRVGEFGKYLGKLQRNLMKALGDDNMALPMLILLKTRMRVGSEIYYKKNKHKGLTTLKKKDLKIVGKSVKFDFVGKDGVPQDIVVSFSEKVVKELRKILRRRKMEDFVFSGKNDGILKDTDFEKAFERFCGERFYPHIVRSYFATREVEKFLKKGKGDARKFCLDLARKLGHKKFSKKSGNWEENFEVTLHYYVRPDLVDKIKKLASN